MSMTPVQEEPTSPSILFPSGDNIFTTVSVTNSETWEKNKKYTVYKVVISSENRTWFVFRRYNEFSKLLELLKKQYPSIHMKLPGKKFFGNNFSSDFIRSRKQGLNDFVQKLLSNPLLQNNSDVLEFLNVQRQVDSVSASTEEEQLLDPESVDTSTEMPDSPDVNFDAKVVDLGPTEKKHAKPGDFEFLKVIGKGSFGKVLLAKHKTEGTTHAVKVLQKKMILKRNEKTHIMCERNVLLKNFNHPFLVRLHYSFQTKDKLYFVLDYVNGGELFFHLQKERIFTETRARFYAAEIASALGYLHSQSIIYRDLKPENLLLDCDGHIVLTDFGLCKDGLEGNHSKTSTFCGTPEYLAPEVLQKNPYDKAVDWWCLGAVLYEMLYGLPPFYNRDTAEMYEAILHKPLKLRPTISLAARYLLEGLLNKDPTLRLGSTNDVEDVRSHDFFKAVNWHELETKAIPAPFNPGVKGKLDVKNIDPEFTKEPVPASVGKSQGLSASVQDPDGVFQGFSYAPPIDFDRL